MIDSSPVSSGAEPAKGTEGGEVHGDERPLARASAAALADATGGDVEKFRDDTAIAGLRWLD